MGSVGIIYCWISTGGLEIPGPVSATVDMAEESIARYTTDCLYINDFWGSYLRSTVAGELRSRGVPDNVATALVKPLIRGDPQNFIKTYVQIPLGNFYGPA